MTYTNKKMEDELKKMEDKPINQNQPNWLRHHVNSPSLVISGSEIRGTIKVRWPNCDVNNHLVRII